MAKDIKENRVVKNKNAALSTKENGVVKNNKWSGIPSTPEELKRINKAWKDIEDCFKMIDKIKK